MARVFIGIGSNLNPAESVRAALRMLGCRLRLMALSTVYETEPFGSSGGPHFYNLVAEAATVLSPGELKDSVLRAVEAELGRDRSLDRHAPRTIDLDLLLYDDLVLRTPQLVLPDPEISCRPFLALPLSELAPDLILPDPGRSIREIAAELGLQTMLPLPGFTALLRKELESDS